MELKQLLNETNIPTSDVMITPSLPPMHTNIAIYAREDTAGEGTRGATGYGGREEGNGEYESFKAQLKTHLFAKACNSI